MKRYLLAGLLWAGLSSTQAASFSTVVIDAGHGGHDRGGIPGQRVAEKVLALDVAKRLEKTLRSAGIKTVMTRRSDVFVSLGARAAMANRYRDAIFVSIHFNSAYRTGARGLETYYHHRSALPLAMRIQGNLMRAVRTENRGVKRRGFYVLRNTRMPSVLVECGFLTNPIEARQAKSSRHRQRLARQIAEAIVSYRDRKPIAGTRYARR